ncbi:MAG TPA: TonB family protein [Thermoanaerobaculia bacterium]
MFETSVVQEQAAVASRRASMLSVSLAAHALVIVGAVGMSIASIDFPKSAPDQFAAFQLSVPVVVPPPLGRPDGGQKPAAQPQPQKPAATPPAAEKDAAPSIVPDDVPTLDPNASSSTATGPVSGEPSGPGTGEGPLGDPNGDPNSVADFNTPVVAGPPQPEEKIYTVGGDVKAPRVIRRAEPRFPQAMIRVGVQGTVKVQCIIDRNGRLQNAKILFSSQPMLNQAVLDSLPEWRFEPASLNGNAVDAYFDLTVTFSLKR